MAYDEELADRIRELVQGERGITEQKMFGGLAFLVHGHMAVVASGQGGLMVRLDPEIAEPLFDEPEVQPVVMRGSEMRGWLRVSEAALGPDEQLARWVTRGLAHARSLPPKPGRP